MADYPACDWQRVNRVVLPRGVPGSYASDVVGDPCIVWDDTVGRWRMFTFVQGSLAGEAGGRTACALSAGPQAVDAGDWTLEGLVPLADTRPVCRPSVYHKWWVLMDARRPNHAAFVEGRYWALFVSFRERSKVIQSASSALLEGPWTVDGEPVLTPGPGGEFDSLHADTPSAFWFADRAEALVFYKGYPREAMPGQPFSPFGSSQATACWRPGHGPARKQRPILTPGVSARDWTDGWIGGLQLLPAGQGWVALINASPTPPARDDNREPAPSQGGWAACAEEWPVTGWRPLAPIERVADLPGDALRAGIGTNLWRHHILLLPDGAPRIYFNSGAYGQEQMYMRVGAARS